MSKTNILSNNTPIAIGGVGGSGTRVVVAIIQQAGIYIGNDLNDALDNLWFSLLFTHPSILGLNDTEFNQRVSIFLAAMTGGYQLTKSDISKINELAAKERVQHSSEWLKTRANSLIASGKSSAVDKLWGWKSPNSHMVIERVARVIDGLKYIHVARNGLDMAFSQNQNQLRIWGPSIFGDDCAITPHNSLRFWCWAHERILRISADLQPNFLFLRFEDICSDPEREIRRILAFIGIESDVDLVRQTAALVTPPETIGRYKNNPLEIFNSEDIAFVQRLGFEVHA